MFRHLLCKLRRKNQFVLVERRNQFGTPYMTSTCKCCGKW